jgi:hypothetical protein
MVLRLPLFQDKEHFVMSSGIKNGTIMIEEGITLPESFNLESEPYSKGWRVVTNFEGHRLDKYLRKIGWTFFYMAAPVRVSVLGFGKDRTFRRAFRKIVETGRELKFNCLEITEAVPKHFLGFEYVYIAGHARNIMPNCS